MKPIAVPRAGGFGIVVPTIVTLLMAILMLMPVRIPGYAAVAPVFVLMGVYHWTIYLPELLPPLPIFVIGLLFDLIAGTHFPGVMPLVLLLSRSIVMSQRGYFVNRLFPFFWAGFAGLAALGIGALWVIDSLLDGVLLDPRAAAFQWVLTVASFPAASYLMVRAQRTFVTM